MHLAGVIIACDVFKYHPLIHKIDEILWSPKDNFPFSVLLIQSDYCNLLNFLLCWPYYLRHISLLLAVQVTDHERLPEITNSLPISSSKGS